MQTVYILRTANSGYRLYRIVHFNKSSNKANSANTSSFNLHEIRKNDVEKFGLKLESGVQSKADAPTDDPEG